MNALNQCIMFHFDVLFDFNSICLAVLKYHGSNYVQGTLLINKSKSEFEVQIQKHPYQSLLAIDNSTLMDIFYEYLPTIKPQIGALDTLFTLSELKQNIIIFTSLQGQAFSILHQQILRFGFQLIHIDQIQKFDYERMIIFDSSEISLVQAKQNHSNTKQVLIKNHSFKNYSYWQILKEKIQQQNTPNFYFYDTWEIVNWTELLGQELIIPFSEKQYKVSLINVPFDKTSLYWNNIVKLQNSIKVISHVTNGYKRGGRQLGIPTANLNMTHEILKQISPLLPGVYTGLVNLNGKNYGSVMSIGFNPYYSNAQKSLEVHLFADFQNEFYHTDIIVQITHFIRVESDFKEFDHLVKFINNDVAFAKSMYEDATIKQDL